MAATPRLITNREFRTSRYGQLADQLEGDLDEIIAQAETLIERHLDRTLSSTTYTEIHRPKLDRLFLKERPIISVTSIERRLTNDAAWSALTVADFEVEPNGAAGVLLSLDDEIAGYEVRVVYLAGYSTIPWDIKSAVLQLTAYLCYQDFETFGQGDSKPPGITYLKSEAYKRVEPYKKVRVF